ncbi:hypothetical protein SAMN05421740_110140 [Parapedobacter koreensis]|uniref:Uncharacterized protein n=1 Tax=Parapedobacter koreensis TaxID=332977 RepID=A0A1H7T7Y2_9SPHI|nr:hypothetical protein SAMN05421740_110140 [Parapedobacter koreensis]
MNGASLPVALRIQSTAPLRYASLLLPKTSLDAHKQPREMNGASLPVALRIQSTSPISPFQETAATVGRLDFAGIAPATNGYKTPSYNRLHSGQKSKKVDTAA